jgi:hypothetical protein
MSPGGAPIDATIRLEGLARRSCWGNYEGAMGKNGKIVKTQVISTVVGGGGVGALR